MYEFEKQIQNLSQKIGKKVKFHPFWHHLAIFFNLAENVLHIVDG